MADVKLVDLKKSYGSVDIIKGVSLDIKHGEFVVFVGPSGCGKSTLLRMISGLEEITDGDLYIAGKRVNDERRASAASPWSSRATRSSRI